MIRDARSPEFESPLLLKNLSMTSHDFLYVRGKPRLSAVRSWFLDLGGMDFDGLKEFFREWRDFDEYLVLQRQVWLGDRLERKTVAVKCSKRGNDVYRRRVERRLGRLRCNDGEFFRDTDKEPRSRVLFVTLTWDPKLCSVHEAWERVSADFNRWITGLRMRYGRISVLRTWEAHQNGYPHVHAMLIFHDYEFRAWKDLGVLHGHAIWRVEEKREFEHWHSWVDVRVARTFEAVVRYIGKRILYGTEKNQDEEHGDLTLALCWVFRKRSFSASKDLAKVLVDLISALHNSKGQVCLDGGFVRVTWVVLGVFSGVELGLDGSIWFSELKEVII